MAIHLEVTFTPAPEVVAVCLNNGCHWSKRGSVPGDLGVKLVEHLIACDGARVAQAVRDMASTEEGQR